MPGTGVHLPGFVESTLRFCSVVTDWFCRLIPDPLKSPSGISRSKLTKKRKLHSSALWDKMEAETINISSSDSDFDMIDEYAEISSASDDEPAPVPTGRVLPNWRPVSHSTGVQNQHPRPPLPIGGPSSSRGTSSLRGHQLPGPSTSYGTDRRASSSNVFRGSEENGGTSHSRRDYENGLQLQKRALPPSFNLSAGARSRQNSSWDNLGGYRGGDNSGSHHSAGPSVSNSKNSGRGSFNRNWENDVHLFDRNELHNSRILPQSMTRGKPGSSTPYGSSPSDPLQNMGYAEERVAGDERLIFQAALQDLSQPKIELDLPIGVLTIPLLRHQKIALAWMVQKESRTMHCLGGILADDQGLGKTISTIALIQKQRSLQMKFQSEENDNHNAEALNLDDDDDDDKGSGSLKASNKTEGVGSDKPETLNLDDDDDDGSASSNAVKKAEEPAGSQRSSDAGSSCQKFQRQRPAAGTLIVCPATVLRQWARELDDKVSEEAKLSVLVYHGGNRTKDPVELAKYDVVLTTYSIVSNEVPKQPIVDEDDVDQKLAEKYGVSPEFSANKKRKNPSGSKKGKKGKLLADSLFSQSGALARVSWFRVVLDEAQTIKNHRTQTARACCGLRAKRRWCLSGTPIQNSIDEVYSYFRYLRHHLYSNYKTFCEGIKYPISRDPNMGYKKLQAVLKTLLLRRTKETLLDGEPIISLPPKHVVMKRVNFSSEERTFYAQLEAESRSQFKAYAAAGTVNQNYANILLMILRLRQACDHPLLVKGFCSVSGSRTNLDKARKLPRNLLMELLNQLEAASAICLICSDPPEDAVISTCRHVFCYQCVADYLTGDDNMCPARRCKKQLSDDVLFSEVTLRSCLSTDADGNLLNNDGSAKNTSILSSEYSSSKVKAAMGILLSHCELNAPYMELDGLDGLGTENSMHAQVRTNKMEGSSSSGPIKTIVFSQWTRMLDLFEFALNQYCIQYRRLDGSMSLVARDRAVRDFNSDPEVTVMLMSLKAGNLGLNMVAASHVILLDLWWNPTTEDQAVDRAHRIGQTRAVTVSRITIKDTVEDRILALQEEKRKMVASAFGEDHVGGTASRLTVDDLRYLFLGSRAA